MENTNLRDTGRAVTVRITSRQTGADGRCQIMESQETGQLFGREGVFYVLYEEMGGQQVKNYLKIKTEPLSVHLKKSGAVFWSVTFEEGRKEAADYQTAYGAIQMEVETERVVLEQTGQKISLQLAYALLIQGVEQTACRLELEIL